MTHDKKDIFLTYWHMFAPLDLGEPVPEYSFDKAIGRKHRFDWAFPVARVAVEIDGGAWLPHGGRHAQDADREKLNIAASLGWRMFRFSPEMIERDGIGCIHLVVKAIFNDNLDDAERPHRGQTGQLCVNTVSQ
jgi:hypothetical protein